MIITEDQVIVHMPKTGGPATQSILMREGAEKSIIDMFGFAPFAPTANPLMSVPTELRFSDVQVLSK